MEGRSRFNERYRVKGHLAGGAHGIILWAVDRRLSRKEGNVIKDNDERVETPTGKEIMPTRFAIKRIFIRNRVVPVSIIREIKSLQFLAGHPNIIELVEVCPLGSSINLIFPLLPLNLTTLIYEHSLNLVQVAIYFRMAVEGVAHLHHQGVMHRDLKPSNMLIDWNGVLKICDFGQARAYQPDSGELSYQVCTRWYRAPELLYGSTSYGTDVDIWSLGCVLAEMLQEWPLFKGENDIEQLGLVVKALGSPPEGEWTDRLPDYNKIQFFSSSNDNDDSDDKVESDDCELYQPESFGNEENQKASMVKFPKWIRKLAKNARPRNFPQNVMSMLASTCRYTGRVKAEQMLQHSFLNQVQINNGQTVAVLNNTSSIIDDSILEPYLIKAKTIKHLSGPPRNIESTQKMFDKGNK